MTDSYLDIHGKDATPIGLAMRVPQTSSVRISAEPDRLAITASALHSFSILSIGKGPEKSVELESVDCLQGLAAKISMNGDKVQVVTQPWNLGSGYVGQPREIEPSHPETLRRDLLQMAKATTHAINNTL